MMYAMKNGLPPHDRALSLQEIADEMVRLGYERLTRERVRQLLKAAPRPRRSQNAVEARRADLQARIRRWASRGTERGMARADKYRLQLDALRSDDTQE